MAHGFLALLANWQGDPSSALDHCRRALDRTAPAAARFRIRHIAARSHGLRGDTRALAEELELADADRNRGADKFDDLTDGIGGEFAFDKPRAAACAAAAWLDAGDGGHAEECAEAALAAYQQTPTTGAPAAILGGVSIDLATASLLQGDLAAASDRLETAFTIIPACAGTSLTGRLRRIEALLGTSRWRDQPAARELVATISH